MMTNKRNRALTQIIVVLLFILTLAPLSGDAQRQSPAHATATRAFASSKPKLVLVIVVDQFRYDYLERFGDLFGSGGFKRLLNEGALFTNANYDYVPTFMLRGLRKLHLEFTPAR